jgi:hypothetical protein
MTNRSLDEVLRELGEVQDLLIAAPSDDFATRAELSNRQDSLRLEAKGARRDVPVDDLAVEQLTKEVQHLEAELARFLDSRPSASAGGPSGGYGGGGIDPDKLHEMHRKMDSSFGFEEKKERLRALKVRLAELSDG